MKEFINHVLQPSIIGFTLNWIIVAFSLGTFANYIIRNPHIIIRKTILGKIVGLTTYVLFALAWIYLLTQFAEVWVISGVMPVHIYF